MAVRGITILGLIIGAGTLLPASAAAEDPAEMRAILEAQALPKWRALREYTKKLQGTIRMEIVYTVAGRAGQTYVSTLRVKQGPDCALYEQSMRGMSPKGDSPTFALGLNPKYAFHIERTTDASDWLLRKVTRNRDERLWQGMPLPLGEAVAGSMTQYLQIEGSAEAFLTNSKLKIESARREEVEGREMWRVAYLATTPEKPSREADAPRSGWVLLDPAHYWCVREGGRRSEFFDEAAPIEVTRQFKHEIEITQAGFPRLKRTTSTQQSPNPKGVMTVSSNVTDFDLREQDNVPVEEFTLSAFGINEPAGVVWKKPTPPWVWVLLAAVVLAALAVLFQYLGRRKSAAEVPSAK